MNHAAEVIDLHPPPQRFEADLLRGLARRPRTIPPKYFYDARGSALFEQITQLPTYYPTRTETRLLHAHAQAIAAFAGNDQPVQVIEPGSGSSDKAQPLLHAMARGTVYTPIEISRKALEQAAHDVAQAVPGVRCQPVCADFTQRLELPMPPGEVARRVVFFPGSTLGNFHPWPRLKLLRKFAHLAGPGGSVVLGLDLTHDPAVLKAAYDDPAGVTAAFNRNVLYRANAELGADFEPERFSHWAGYCPRHRRVEMHLVSQQEQRVSVRGRSFIFARGDTILTECSYKFDLDQMADLARRAGLEAGPTFTDADGRFGIVCLGVISANGIKA